MIQMQTNLDVADNSGARRVQCIKVLGGSKRKWAHVGDVIVVSVKEAIPRGRVKKGDVHQAVIVRVERRVMHPLYKKFVSRSKKYAAHDADNRYRTGDTVRIEECRPISKRKSWLVIEGPADAAPGRRHAAPASAAEQLAAEAAAAAGSAA